MAVKKKLHTVTKKATSRPYLIYLNTYYKLSNQDKKRPVV